MRRSARPPCYLCIHVLPLFDDDKIGPFTRSEFHRKLSALAKESLFIGTSSWKYEGWLGQIYSRERYLTRGRFSRKYFQEACLAEYAETFPIVCGDFSFYQFPALSYWDRLFGLAPNLQFALKVPEEITVRSWPAHRRYGPRAGLKNSGFLDAELLAEQFTSPLERYRERVALLIFEFGTFSKAAYPDGAAGFVADLAPFLDRLPAGFRYAVEVRNRDFLHPLYFHTLQAYGVAHVYSSWTRMPELAKQMDIEEAHTADFLPCRALLRPGRSYEQAVQRFQPYETVQDPYPAGTESLERFLIRARERGQPAFVFVNNRFEGNSPGTIANVIADL